MLHCGCPSCVAKADAAHRLVGTDPQPPNQPTYDQKRNLVQKSETGVLFVGPQLDGAEVVGLLGPYIVNGTYRPLAFKDGWDPYTLRQDVQASTELGAALLETLVAEQGAAGVEAAFKKAAK